MSKQRRPSVDDYRSAIEALTAIHRAGSAVSVGRAKAERLLVLHGLVEHVFCMTSAAVTLLDNGQVPGAFPLARIALEHAMVAQWVHLDPHGIEGFRLSNDKKRTAFIRSTWNLEGVPEAVIDAYEELPEIPVRVPPAIANFEATCDALDNSGWIYAMYRMLSCWVHPSAGTNWEYVRETGNSAMPYALSHTPEIHEPVAPMFTLAYACVLASGVYEDIRKAKPNKPAVKRIAAGVGMTPILSLQTPNL